VSEVDAAPASEVNAVNGYVLELRQRFTLMQNRYDLVRLDADETETPLAYAEQKRFSLKEKVTFWTDESRSGVAFTIAARNMMEFVGEYDVCDARGTILTSFRKDAASSLLRSTYLVQLDDGLARGRERGPIRAFLRRMVMLLSLVPLPLASLSGIIWPLPIHFDFVDRQDRPLMSIERKLRLRDTYRVRVDNGNLDWRIAAALAVAVDAFMNR
jgi:uncharacterized protein YxjI